MSTAARELRARAERMRCLSHALASSVIVDLRHVGGPSIWRGPTASSFSDQTLAACRAVEGAVDDLDRAAHWMLAEADRLDNADRAAARTAGNAPVSAGALATVRAV